MTAAAEHRSAYRPQRVHCPRYVAKRHWWLDPAHAAAVAITLAMLNSALVTALAYVAADLRIHVPWWGWPVIVVAFSAAIMQPWRRAV